MDISQMKQQLIEILEELDNINYEHPEDVDKLRNLQERIEEIRKQIEEIKNKKVTYSNMTDEELEKELSKVREQINDLWHFRAHEQNGMEENLDDLRELIKKEEELNKELERRKKKIVGENKKIDYSKLTDEELQKLLNKVNEQINDLWNFRAHEQNGMEQNDDNELDDLIKKKREIEDELEKRKKKKEKEKDKGVDKDKDKGEPEDMISVDPAHLPIPPERKKPPVEKPPVQTPPVQTPPVTTPTEVKPEKPKVKRGYLSIIAGLVKGLPGIESRKAGKRYQVANMKVTGGFFDELKNRNNYLYKVVYVGSRLLSPIFVPINLIRKARANILLSRQSRDDIKELQNRFDKLSDEDKLTLCKEFKNTNLVSHARDQQTLIDILLPKMQEFAAERTQKLNDVIDALFEDLFKTKVMVDELNSKLAKPGLTDKQKKNLYASRNGVLKGCAQKIKKLRDAQQEARDWMEGGFIGMQMGQKAATTGMNVQGYRFGKKYDMDTELAAMEGQLEDKENDAIAKGSDAQALNAFVALEKLQQENTKIEGSIFGRRSTGHRYYNPHAEILNYRDDPFVTDVVRSLANVGMIYSFASQMAENARLAAAQQQRAEQLDSAQAQLQNAQAKIDGVDSANAARAASVNSAGRRLETDGEKISKGMEYQAHEGVVTHQGLVERNAQDSQVLETGGYSNPYGSTYQAIDTPGHLQNAELGNNVASTISSINARKLRGEITSQQAIDEISSLYSSTSETVRKYIEEYLPTLREYRAGGYTTKQLESLEQSLEFMVNNPNAVEKMCEGLSDVVGVGKSLESFSFASVGDVGLSEIGVTLAQAQAFDSLPISLKQEVIGLASGLIMASTVKNQMTMGMAQGKYGNKATSIVEDYSRSR